MKITRQSDYDLVCPVYNEEKYIQNILDFYQALPHRGKKLWIIDGRSVDRTREIVEAAIKKDPSIHLLDNPQRFVPEGLNLAIRKSSSPVVIRIDAHTEYAPDYVERILETFETTDADIAGGPMRAKGNTVFQRAVAYCTSNSFGVGNSAFHDETASGYVDSVYLGAWKRSIFDTTGYFDPEMLRNQDDEFHYRARSHGFSIYLNPHIRSFYYPRSDLRSLFRQYFQYGLFKPLVLKKVKSGLKLRHLIPAGFVTYLLAAILLSNVLGIMAWIPFLLYLLLDIFFSLRCKAGFKEKLACLLVYPSLHIAYGTGFILGLSGKPKAFMR